MQIEDINVADDEILMYEVAYETDRKRTKQFGFAPAMGLEGQKKQPRNDKFQHMTRNQ